MTAILTKVGAVMCGYVEVAVAVIAYQGQFLLARRGLSGAEAGKLEFVGGKIEQGESAEVALLRELQEEIGVSFVGQSLCKMGEVTPVCTTKQPLPSNAKTTQNPKSLRLHVYQIVLDQSLYHRLKDKHIGAENQPLYWLTKTQLWDKRDQLPAANSQILEWLK